jgi:hypothetical protein
MDFGICVASKIDEVGYLTHAENLLSRRTTR